MGFLKPFGIFKKAQKIWARLEKTAKAAFCPKAVYNIHIKLNRYGNVFLFIKIKASRKSGMAGISHAAY
jgi:hypothetical protein